MPKNGVLKSLIGFSILLGSQLYAQTEEQLVEIFSGDWIVVDSRFSSDGAPCKIRFEDGDMDQTGWRSIGIGSNCTGTMLPQSFWKVENDKIALRGSDGNRYAELGGEPTRLSGEIAGEPDAIVLERIDGSGIKAELIGAIARYKCYFLGYTDVCATATATSAPDISSGTASVEVLVDLNVRTQPRRNASPIGIVPAGSTISVNLCLATSDGIWCRANFGEQSGWMPKSAIRRSEWPVLTFVNATNS